MFALFGLNFRVSYLLSLSFEKSLFDNCSFQPRDGRGMAETHRDKFSPEIWTQRVSESLECSLLNWSHADCVAVLKVSSRWGKWTEGRGIEQDCKLCFRNPLEILLFLYTFIVHLLLFSIAFYLRIKLYMFILRICKHWQVWAPCGA